jgi:hypothetical protein
MAESLLAYGARWNTNDHVDIELKLYSMPDELRERVPGALERVEHLRRAIRLLLPDENGLRWHRWLDDATAAWCENDIMSWWGPSSAGKSAMAGLLFYVDLLAAPAHTYTVMVTDTLKNHEKRVWSQILKWRGMMPSKWQVGRVSNTMQVKRIVTGTAGTVAGIYCTFMDRLAKAEDLKDKLGGHNKRNRLCVDEAQSVGKVALDIIQNLSAGGEGWRPYRELFIGNPDAWDNTLGLHSLPKDGDMKRCIDQDVTEWETARGWNDKPGRCLVFDARNSPALDSPAETERLPFLPSVKWLQNMRAQTGGENTRGYWTYAIGRVAPALGRPVVLSELDAQAAGAAGPRPWADGSERERFVGIDTSTGVEGSDGVPLVLGEVGAVKAGLDFYPTTGKVNGERRLCAQVVGLESARPNVRLPDLSGQIAAKIVETVTGWRVPWRNVAIEAGGQQNHLIDRIESMAGCHGQIKRINPAGPASTRIVSRQTGATARERIATRAAELALNLGQVIREGSLCRVPDVILKQLSTRETKQENGKTDIQNKRDWGRENGGKSPDESDAAAVMVELLIARGVLRLGEPVAVRAAEERYPMDWMNPDKVKGRQGEVARLVKRW